MLNTMDSKTNGSVKNGSVKVGHSDLSMVDVSPTGSSANILGDKDAESGEDKKPTTCCAPETSGPVILFKILLCIVAGILFGWCLEKSRVFEPASIRYQMVFKRWIMLKMFLAAVASGQLIMSILSIIPRTKVKFQDALDSYGCCFTEKGILTSALGPFILGAGMTLSGACPGMVLPQVGSWTKNAIFTFIGVLIGALLYGLFGTWIVKITKPRNPFKIHTVHEKIKVPYIAIALPMAVVLTLTVFLMEWFINWEDDLDPINRNINATSNIFILKSWPPSAAGGVIGVLQLIIILGVTDTLGGSSSYMTIVSQWVVTKKLQDIFPYLAKARCGLGNWWQVVYVLSAVGGGTLSAFSSQSLGTTKGANIPTALCGGIMMLLGARLAAGCTSGHGLSGMGLLFWLSFVAVPFMFGGGIVTGFSMQATGALDDWSYH